MFTYPWTQPGQPNMGAIHGDEVVFVWDYVAVRTALILYFLLLV